MICGFTSFAAGERLVPLDPSKAAAGPWDSSEKASGAVSDGWVRNQEPVPNPETPDVNLHPSPLPTRYPNNPLSQ